ncbi:hypothetical protein TNCV_1981231 [Trichonephila clavipes]|nr:hypothetical protein TNCV_1981231 [Trichonephila clavipes]
MFVHTLAERGQRSGRPQTPQNAAVDEKVETLVMKDHRLTIRETTEQVEISTCSPHAILCVHAQRSCEIYPNFRRWNRKTSSCSCTGPTGD